MLEQLIEHLLDDDEGISSDAYSSLLEYLDSLGKTELLEALNNRVRACNGRYYVV